MSELFYAKKCEEIAYKIDNLADNHDYKGLSTYLLQIETSASTNNSLEYAPIYYYLGTGTATYADYLKDNNGSTVEINEQRKKTMFYFRKAMELFEGFEKDNVLVCSNLTNYANNLISCGRIIEALNIFRKTISIDSTFNMAIANYGRALGIYANLVNDSGHKNELHCYAYQTIKKALQSNKKNMHDGAIGFFNEIIIQYENSPGIDFFSLPIVQKKFNIGRGEERAYRKWCLENHLFLNPLNDLIDEETSFAHDPLTIIKYTESITNNKEKSCGVEPPKWFAMLNQLKEEYAYSRYLCYEGITKDHDLHFADKDVKLSLASYDYVNYSMRLEQLRTAFKNLFSIFDQIAFFVNEFWSLGFNERNADAKHVFKSKNYPTDNIALTALYWIYSELVEKFGESETPSEEKIKTLRNALEHKFVKIHEFDYDKTLEIKSDSFYHISEADFKKLVIRLLELAREFIMELVYAVEIEEKKNENSENSIGFTLREYDDSWKL